MPPLTVLIPCRNEQARIGACVAAVRGLADEILVADSGSTDDTVGVVRRLGGCRIIRGPFTTFADFKNWAIPQARHSWVLVVDADEIVTSELAREVRHVLRAPPSEIDGYEVPRWFYFMGHRLRFSGCQTERVLRLFRRDRCRYGPCRVHEAVRCNPDRVAALRGPLLHFSYWSYDEYLARHTDYTRWAALDLRDAGRGPRPTHLLFRPFFRFLHLYVVRLGFLDGLAGFQYCMLTAFFNTFVKQGRLWEMWHAGRPPAPVEPPAVSAPRPPTRAYAAASRSA